MLTRAGMKEPSARVFLGKLRKEHGEDALALVIGEAAQQDLVDPKAWLVANIRRFASAQVSRGVKPNSVMSGVRRLEQMKQRILSGGHMADAEVTDLLDAAHRVQGANT